MLKDMLNINNAAAEIMEESKERNVLDVIQEADEVLRDIARASNDEALIKRYVAFRQLKEHLIQNPSLVHKAGYLFEDSWLDKKVRNPKTGNEVKVKSLPKELRSKFKPRDAKGNHHGKFLDAKEKHAKSKENYHALNKEIMNTKDHEKLPDLHKKFSAAADQMHGDERSMKDAFSKYKKHKHMKIKKDLEKNDARDDARGEHDKAKASFHRFKDKHKKISDQVASAKPHELGDLKKKLAKSQGNLNASHRKYNDAHQQYKKHL